MPPVATTKLPALFFVFMERRYQGKLPFTYQDGILDEAAVRAMYESADPIHVFATDKALFGELAAKPEFEALLREQVAEVRKLVG